MIIIENENIDIDNFHKRLEKTKNNLYLCENKKLTLENKKTNIEKKNIRETNIKEPTKTILKDNASIHKAKLIKKTINKNKIKVIYGNTLSF